MKSVLIIGFLVTPLLGFSQPDLIVETATYPASVKQYQQFNGTITIKNIGISANDKFNVASIYFSKDSNYSADDVWGGTISFTDLAPGAVVTKSIIGNANQFGVNADEAYQYVVVRADYRNEVSESDETNNLWSGPITIENAQVDLAVKSAVKNGPNPVHQGDNLSITTTLINLGTDPIHNTFYEYFISSDPVLDAGDARIGYLNYASFSWTMEAVRADNPTVPATLEPGLYYVLIRINTSGQELDIADYDLSNNIKSLFQIDVKKAVVNSILNFDQEFGTKTWTEDNHQWTWTGGWDNIRNYRPKKGSGHGMAGAGNGAKLSTTSNIDIKGIWISLDFSTTYSSLEMKGYDDMGNQVYVKALNPADYFFQYAYVTLNWENVRSFQINHEITSHSGGGVFYDEMDYTYLDDQSGPLLECPNFWISNCGSTILPDYSYLLNPNINCGEVQFIQTPAPGTVFTNRQMNVRISATDECNNSYSCNFVVSNGGSSIVEEVACLSYTSPSGKIWEDSGIYLDTIPNYVGCDSVITVKLTINRVDTLVTFNQTELVASATDASYQWLKCNEDGGYSVLENETNKTYTLTEAGRFAVEVVQGGCALISDCHTIIVVGLEDNAEKSIVAFPNPVTNSVTIKLGKVYENVGIELRDISGKVVSTLQKGTTNEVDLGMESLSNGFYFLTVFSNSKKLSVVKIVKN